MYETLSRTIDPTPAGGVRKVEDAVRRIREVEGKKERRREGQIREAKRRREEKRREAEGGAEGEEREGKGEDAGAGADDGPDPKRARRTDDTAAAADSSAPSTPAPAQGANRRVPRSEREFAMKTGAYARGHTSFLTFAMLLPEPEEPRRAEVAEEGGEGGELRLAERGEAGEGDGERMAGVEE
jgi:tRNA (adenine57-N1/adenine58-N1)-methyltransferase